MVGEKPRLTASEIEAELLVELQSCLRCMTLNP